MRHLWLCAELHKLPSMCCFCTVRDCQKIAEVPPLQIPSFKSFENRTDFHVFDLNPKRSFGMKFVFDLNPKRSFGMKFGSYVNLLRASFDNKGNERNWFRKNYATISSLNGNTVIGKSVHTNMYGQHHHRVTVFEKSNPNQQWRQSKLYKYR